MVGGTHIGGHAPVKLVVPGGRKPVGIGDRGKVPRQGWLFAIERSGVGPRLAPGFPNLAAQYARCKWFAAADPKTPPQPARQAFLGFAWA